MIDRSAGPDGVLLLDKPAGITSTQALARSKRLLGSLKAGHTGTLDPFATGLLPIAFGEATKFSRFLIDAPKSYEATLALGAETATGDTESPPIKKTDVRCSSDQIDEVLGRFVGPQDQIPPMHSAVRVDGRRLYDYARKGQEIARPARRVHIEELRRLDFAEGRLSVAVTCSKGTYIRTLAQDIGRALGCGAYLVALRRMAVGGFGVSQAITLETLAAEGIESARGRLLPPQVLVSALTRFEATPEEARRFGHGRVIDRGVGAEADVAVFAPDGRFLGVGRESSPGAIAPLRLMADAAAKCPDFS